MRTKLSLLFLLVLFSATFCVAQNDFSEKLDTTFTTETIRIADELEFDILAISQDCTVYNPSTDSYHPMKGSFGKVWFFPADPSAASQKEGTVYVTHKTNEKSSGLGDGGGLIKFRVQRQANNKWEVIPSAPNVYFVNVDLGTVGGSVGDNDITLDRYSAEHKTILISESLLQESNTTLGEGMTNVSNYTVPSHLTQAYNPAFVVPANTQLPRYKQMNWMIEVNAETGSPIQKVYGMGRFNHAYCVKAMGAYYFTTGRTPSVLFRWRADDLKNLQIGGELSVFKQSDDPSMPDEFISLNNIKSTPDGDSTWQSFDSLLVAEQQALRAGATMFASLSGMAVDFIDGTEVLYIAERGIDNSADAFINPAKKFKGVLANHLKTIDAADGSQDNVVHDYKGRILAYTADGKMTVMLEGGTSSNGKYNFSNPEGLSIVNGPNNDLGATKYMVIKENILGIDHGRNPAHVADYTNRINEAYWVKTPVEMDYSAFSPFPKRKSVDDLTLFVIGPKGAELMGGSTTDALSVFEKNNTYFATISNPKSTNQPVPNNRSMVIAVRGLWGEGLISSILKSDYTRSANFQVWPNPATSTLYFNKKTSVGIYNAAGMIMKVYEDVEFIDISELNPGMYFITNSDREVKKIIVE